MMELFHGSQDKTLTHTLDNSIFPGFFFSRSLRTAESFGDYVYQIDIADEKILSKQDLFNILYDSSDEKGKAELRDKLYNNVHYFSSYYIEELMQAGYSRKEAEELLEEIILEEKKQEELFDIISDNDYGGFLWDLQKIRGQVAFSLGFQAIEMTDETGRAYLVRPGVALKRYE